jgi:transposase
MIDLRQCSFSSIVTTATHSGGPAVVSTRRHSHAKEEEEPRYLDRGRPRHAGGLDRPWPRPGSPVDPCSHPLEGRRGRECYRRSLARHQDRRRPTEISRSTVSRVRERFVAEGLEAALLHRKPKRTKPKKLDGSQEAHLIALACSEPPRGRKRWSVRLLAERFVELECAEEPISRELVRRTLKKVP